MSEPSSMDQLYRNAEEGHHAVPVEASDPAQDWVRQQMIKHYISVFKEEMKFTDIQIINGMQCLRERGEVINFRNLLNILIETENCQMNMYVGTKKYAFSIDVKIVLDECYEIYGREPTQAEFDMQWNEIRGTGIEYWINQSNLKDVEIANKEAEISERDNQMTDLTRMMDRLLERTRILDNEVDIQRMQALQERNRADKSHREKLEALKDVILAVEDRNEAVNMRNTAIEEILKTQEKAKRLEQQRMKIQKEKEAERIKNEKLEKEKEAERIKNEKLEKEKEAERIKNEKLEKEKEAERIKNEKLEKEKEAERIKNEKLEKEKEAERIKNEKLEKEKEAERIKNEKLEKEKEAERIKNENLEKEKEAERLKNETLAEENRKLLQQIEQLRRCVGSA